MGKIRYDEDYDEEYGDIEFEKFSKTKKSKMRKKTKENKSKLKKPTNVVKIRKQNVQEEKEN